MTYRLLADIVVLLHLGFIAFAVLGGLLALRWRSALFFHVPTAVWGGFVEVTGRVCPLTPVENWLRHAAGGAGYDGGFIEHYLIPIVYPAGLTREVQLVLAALLLAANAIVYMLVWRRWRSERASQEPAA